MTLAVPLTASFPAQGAAALAGQLRAAGLAEVLPAPAGGPAAGLRHLAALARAGTGPLVVCGTDVVAHTAALLTLVTEPGDGSVALVGAVEDATAWSAAVREDRGRVVAAAPAGAVDGGTGAFLGVLRVGRADLPVLAECAERLAAGLAAGTAPTAGDPADLLLPELVQAGVRVA
ncbi:MAG TPA: CDP-alcohol phosphatidyltransferase family protein, partial [Pilimelia sp.]|nr:CDP-alcohol phosphatidyltransferase family protein [Pilimelia sp.]